MCSSKRLLAAENNFFNAQLLTTRTSVLTGQCRIQRTRQNSEADDNALSKCIATSKIIQKYKVTTMNKNEIRPWHNCHSLSLSFIDVAIQQGVLLNNGQTDYNDASKGQLVKK